MVNSVSTHLSVTEGTLDKETRVVTTTFQSRNPRTGELVDMKSVTSRPSDDARKTVMYAKRDGDWIKSFEIDLQRQKQ